MYHSQDATTIFPEALAGTILQHKATTYKEIFTNERKLNKQQKQNQQLEYEEPWPIPDALHDTLCDCFKIKSVFYCNPMTLTLRAKEYISHYPRDAIVGDLPYTKTVWPDASLALPTYKAEHFTIAVTVMPQITGDAVQ